MKFSMKIEGLAELERKLTKTLPAATQMKVMRSALMHALTPIQKAAKALVPAEHSDLKRAITKKSLITKANKFKAEAGIHMKTSRKKFQAGWRWHFIEFGTDAHIVKPLQATAKNRVAFGEEKKVMAGGGKIYGTRARIPTISKQPFLRPAFDAKDKEALRRFKMQLAKRIKKETK